MKDQILLRLRMLCRRLPLGLALMALGIGMTVAVGRGSEARDLTETLASVERESAAQRARVAKAMRRLDSLTSRERIEAAAAELGLRPADDEEIIFLRADAADGGSPLSPASDRREGDR